MNSENDFREKLSEEEYEVLRNRGTEPRGTGKYLDHKEDGTYCCKACGQEIFDSETKFGSGSGWPSFYEAIEDSVEFRKDERHGRNRTEVVCSNCESHLGHVFGDGPEPTGKRYCVNSVALEFEKK